MLRPKVVVHGRPSRQPGVPRSVSRRGLVGLAMVVVAFGSAGLPGDDVAYSWALPLNCPLHQKLTHATPAFVPAKPVEGRATTA